MTHLGFFSFALLFSVTIFDLPRTRSCMCGMQHPQITFCSSDYAFKFVVKSKREVRRDEGGKHTTSRRFRNGGWNTQTKYRIKVLKVFKGNSSTNEMKTLYTDPVCSVELKVHHKYIVMEKFYGDNKDQVYVSLCSYVMDVTDQAPQELRHLTRNLQVRYPRSCGDCTICLHYDLVCRNRHARAGNSCVWSLDLPSFFSQPVQAAKYSCMRNTHSKLSKHRSVCTLRYPIEFTKKGEKTTETENEEQGEEEYSGVEKSDETDSVETTTAVLYPHQEDETTTKPQPLIDFKLLDVFVEEE